MSPEPFPEPSLADIRLFQFQAESVRELPAESAAIEKSLQSLLEKNLESFLGVRLLASEYSTGKRHGGRIDTLGLDDNNCPVIIEYKRALNENVINQGLFYLDWLMDHRGEFTLQVLKRFGPQVADSVDWTAPRLLCIAGDFTRYDEYAVMQIPRNVELLRYRRYGSDLLLLELVNAGVAEKDSRHSHSTETHHKEQQADEKADITRSLEELWKALRDFLLSMGDDVTERKLEHYTAFRRMKNFACARALSEELQVWIKVDPTTVKLREGFTRDVSKIGHLGTGDLEIRLRTMADLEEAKPLLARSYGPA